MGYRSTSGLDGFNAVSTAGVWISAEGSSATLTGKSDGQALFQALDANVFMLAKKSLFTVAAGGILIAGAGGVKVYPGRGTSHIERIGADDTAEPTEALEEIIEGAEASSVSWELFDTAYTVAALGYLLATTVKLGLKAEHSKRKKITASVLTATSALAAAGIAATNLQSIGSKNLGLKSDVGSAAVLNLHADAGITFATPLFTSIYGTLGYVSFGAFAQVWGGATAGVVSFGLVEMGAPFGVAAATAKCGKVSLSARETIELTAEEKIVLRGATATELGSITPSKISQRPTGHLTATATETVSLQSTGSNVYVGRTDSGTPVSAETKMTSGEAVSISTTETIELSVGEAKIVVTPTGIEVTTAGGSGIKLSAEKLEMTGAPDVSTSITNDQIKLKTPSSHIRLTDSKLFFKGSVITFG